VAGQVELQTELNELVMKCLSLFFILLIFTSEAPLQLGTEG
jgi:hypothetical protein